MTKEILCTLGPASMDAQVIRRLEELGATLFRINLSHTTLSALPEAIRFIQDCSDVPVCVDSEGAQIRTGDFVHGQVEMRENTIVRAYFRRVPGDPFNFNLYPRNIAGELKFGDFISIDFDSVLVQVIDFENSNGNRCVVMRVLNGGIVGSNKAVTVDRDMAMPALTEKDAAAIPIALSMGVRHFALSFANRSSDVEAIRKITSEDSVIISKIECLKGLRNLDSIAAVSDALLIDRGDLSRQVAIEKIPRLQKKIIGQARALDKKVYVATNLLESMVTASVPTRAEVNDIYNTLADGADGLVLAAETAIGAYPVRCATMVVKLIQEFENGSNQAADHGEPISMLRAPHGGKLVFRMAGPDEQASADQLPKLQVSDTTLLDCEQIALGTYSPLCGFMDRDTLSSVLETNRLPDGTVWTLPIILQINNGDRALPFPGDRVALTGDTGRIHALLDVSEVYHLDLEEIATQWFGTASLDHPGVRRLRESGDLAIGGNILLVERLSSPYRQYELTPAQTRFIFSHKGWNKVVGFHTRNVVHRVHHHIQLDAIERSGADGLYISPVIGPKKPHDFLPGPIMKSYQLLLDFGQYDAGRAVLGSFSTYSRYSGPREAVFTAICRKNMGCSHFIIGRDHTGVGNFYAPDANAVFFESIGDIGIEPIFFEAIGYDPKSAKYISASNEGVLEPISGTMARETLLAGKRLPGWFMHDMVQDMLFEEISNGNQVFYS